MLSILPLLTNRLPIAAATLLLLILCSICTNAAEFFREDFEYGLGRWNVTCPAKIIAEPNGNHFLKIDEGGMQVNDLNLPAEFTLSARIRVPSPQGSGETPFLLHCQPDGKCVQVYLEYTNGSVIAGALGGKPWFRGVGSQPFPTPLHAGEWVSVRIVCAHGCIGVWLNDKPALITQDPLPKAGGFGVRTGGSSEYDDLAIAAPTREDREFNGLREQANANFVSIERRLSAKSGGQDVTLAHDSVALPLKPLSIAVSGADAPFQVTVISPDKSAPPTNHKLSGKVGGSVDLNGPHGKYMLIWKYKGRELGRTEVALVPATNFGTNDPADNQFFQILKRTVQENAATHHMGDRALNVNPCWVRDHIHEMKAYKWWKTDLTSFIDCLIDYQTLRGFFYEISIGKGDMHFGFVTPEFKTSVGEDALIRLEIEADVEYLMVEGVYQIWQATGDKAAMAKRLPALERGLEYDFNDPTRWDKEHGLLKRPFSIDTWDFVWGSSTSVRYIKPEMPMAIMHGDNSGLYQACLQVAEMNEALGKMGKAADWRERAKGIRSRANALLWNGSFYTHEYHLTPVSTGADENQILSLSNTYDINRGMPTHEMAVKIIDEYKLHRQTNSSDFAEWYTIEPPYPEFVGYKAGEYCNGGLAGFVGGELAKAAFRSGREDYGADILKRLRKVALDKGTMPFFMQRSDGADKGGGPNGWSAAAVMSALMEGLAGLTDRGVLFNKVEVAPRYTAAGITKARASLCYGPSKAYIATTYLHDVKARRIVMQLTGAPHKAHFHVLLPKAMVPAAVRVDGKSLKPVAVRVEQSTYCDFDITRAESGVTSIAVEYRPF